LSRLKPTNTNPAKQKYDVLALLSGPEPQRSILEDKLLEVLVGSGLKVAIVRGLPEEQNDLNEKNSNENINEFVWFNHLNTKKIGELISESKTIICRSGYSTLMDLAVLNRSAILIPTPGQTEQEYLAKHFEKHFGFKRLKQSQLKKLPALLKSESNQNANFRFEKTDFTPLEKLINR
jgi:UDP-N-acetylglucosamine:LPS N-acetylglucosamine transferase